MSTYLCWRHLAWLLWPIPTVEYIIVNHSAEKDLSITCMTLTDSSSQVFEALNPTLDLQMLWAVYHRHSISWVSYSHKTLVFLGLGGFAKFYLEAGGSKRHQIPILLHIHMTIFAAYAFRHQLRWTKPSFKLPSTLDGGFIPSILLSALSGSDPVWICICTSNHCLLSYWFYH